ncbi:NLR family CARD domain-containing protein 3-like [Takifugu flavidus]|uniref:NLR family CARD domain-containing protein 3-like n=1 Tax=Takifugu flavidus TaxID=433684 RepID=UPI002544A8E5|nr:NLR family CARD domain-containing protein 3-like [Takifugu flavidus]
MLQFFDQEDLKRLRDAYVQPTPPNVQENHLTHQGLQEPPHHVSDPNFLLDHCYSSGGHDDQRPERRAAKTLTDLYSHFLRVQIKRKKQKYGGKQRPEELTEADKELLLKLGRLAFEHLEKGNIMFYSEDLERCGLDVSEVSVYSGVCTEIFKRESVIFQKSVYCFVHLSIQEFLAAVYMFHRYTRKDTAGINQFLEYSEPATSLDDFLRRALMKSLKSKNGHLDLFVRFLHGLSLESNQRILGGLLDQRNSHPKTIQKVLNNLKVVNSDEFSPDRSINIFHCLMEMKDQSVHQEIQEFLKSGKKSRGDCQRSIVQLWPTCCRCQRRFWMS